MALPKPPVPTYELELPSTGKAIKYRPFLVKEEKLLLIATETGDDKAMRDAIVEILKACILTRGVKVEDLPMFDLEYVFLRIRSKSVGEVVEMIFTAKDDNDTKLPYKLNLEEVEVLKPEGHNKKVMLTDTAGLIMKYPSMEQFITSQILQKEQTTEEVFDEIINCVEQIFDGDEVWEAKTTTKKDIKEYLEGLTSKQFEAIQKFFSTMPKVSHTFTLTNPNTGVDSEYTIEGLTNFFG
jgi:hypothetical protein